jgi:hypothetical protein
MKINAPKSPFTRALFPKLLSPIGGEDRGEGAVGELPRERSVVKR